MIITGKKLERRTFLRGLGAAIALPFLDAMTPALRAAQAGAPPVRLAWFYVPNGIDMRNWTPANEGALTAPLPRILKPLEAVKDEVTVLSNLTANWGRPLLVGAGDHGRAAAAYMTGVEVYRTAGADLKLAVSADQIAASVNGHLTKFPSIEIGMEETRQAGNCDNGYSCAYAYNMAWKTEHQPLPPISEPRSLFERLFGSDIVEPPAAHLRRLAMRKSILDMVSEDTQKLQIGLGTADRRKLDEYLSSVREIEKQVERSEKDGMVIDTGMEKPFGVPPEFSDYFRLMADMMVVAFQADLTRVATVMIGREGSNRPYPEIGVPDAHHPITHHQNNPVLLEKVCQINCYHMELFAELIKKMKATKEGDSNLLDNSILCYGGGLSDGNVHTHDQLPHVIAGRGGNFISPGRHIIYQRETPVANLFATMLERVGVRPEHVGDATGRLAGLSLT